MGTAQTIGHVVSVTHPVLRFQRDIINGLLGVTMLLFGQDPAGAQIQLSEVMSDPPGSEHHDEFVELWNSSRTDSLDLTGWLLGDADEMDEIVAIGPGAKLAPGGLALILDGSYLGASTTYDSVHESVRIVTIEDRAFGQSGWSNSASEQVILMNAVGDTVDAFSYHPAAGRPGHSWERRRSDAGWQLSLWIGGTPGQPNSADQSPAEEGRIVMDLSDPFSERLHITCRLPFAPALLSVTVFDTEGNLVARLLDWEPASFVEAVEWDGQTDDGKPSPAGLYVLSAQASANGQIVREKTVFTRQ
jgi:hypothetical protein